MNNDFETVVDRRHTDSLKWDVEEHELPMWVADMDFKTADVILQALKERIDQGVLGYTVVNDAWYKAIQSWWERRHGIRFETETMIFTTGIVPAITTAVQRLTNIGDKVLIQTPTFNVFYNSILNHGRQVLENPLSYKDGLYSIDFEDLKIKLSDPLTRLMILCNPQNPSGNLWSKQELMRIGELCHQYGVTVLADEIHCDLVDPGFAYTPFASVDEICRNLSITCVSATKAFNLAGLQSAAVIVPNPILRAIMDRGLNSNEVAEPNVFATLATITAFEKGETWLEELRQTIRSNKTYTYDFILDNFPDYKPVISHATYLVWIDLGQESQPFCHHLRKETGLVVSSGTQFGGNGNTFIRLNIACPRIVLEDGLNRLKQYYITQKNSVQP